MNKHYYGLILAGGAGTRLYPRSREARPKQFQKIIGDKKLIEQTFDRVRQLVPNENIYISCSHKHVDLVKKYLLSVPPENIISEPLKKNTGPAMALATAIIAQKDPKAIIISIHSDHLVLKTEEYINAIKAGAQAVEKNYNYIVTIGITPTSPHTGYGYIEKGKLYQAVDGFVVFVAKRFVEKPDIKTAQKYLASANFLWNAGYFVWQAKHFLDELKKYHPGMLSGVNKIISNPEVLDREFHRFDEIAVDNLIMEKTEKLLVIPADLGWSDIGSWDVVANMVADKKKDKSGNFIEGLVITHDTHNSTILNSSDKKLIALVGVDNLIVVESEGALVIAKKGRSEEIKKIVEKLKEKKLEQFL